jgi:hypothetical protein
MGVNICQTWRWTPKKHNTGSSERLLPYLLFAIPTIPEPKSIFFLAKHGKSYRRKHSAVLSKMEDQRLPNVHGRQQPLLLPCTLHVDDY